MAIPNKETDGYTIQESEGFTSVTLVQPRLDAVIANRLKSELIILSGLGQRNIVLDLARCTYCDSSGLSVLLVGNRLCRNAGGVFVLRNLAPQVERLINISHLDSVLAIAYSEEQAQNLLNR